MDVQNIRLDFHGIVDGAKCMDYSLEGFLLRTLDVNNLDALPVCQTVRNIIAAPNYRYINVLRRNHRKQLLAMRLHPAHHIRNTASACYDDFQNFSDLKYYDYLCGAMKKFFATIIEAIQYVGIAIISCISAVWLWITGRGRR